MGVGEAGGGKRRRLALYSVEKEKVKREERHSRRQRVYGPGEKYTKIFLRDQAFLFWVRTGKKGV